MKTNERRNEKGASDEGRKEGKKGEGGEEEDGWKERADELLVRLHLRVRLLVEGTHRVQTGDADKGMENAEKVVEAA